MGIKEEHTKIIDNLLSLYREKIADPLNLTRFDQEVLNCIEQIPKLIETAHEDMSLDSWMLKHGIRYEVPNKESIQDLEIYRHYYFDLDTMRYTHLLVMKSGSGRGWATEWYLYADTEDGNTYQILPPRDSDGNELTYYDQSVEYEPSNYDYRHRLISKLSKIATRLSQKDIIIDGSNVKKLYLHQPGSNFTQHYVWTEENR